MEHRGLDLLGLHVVNAFAGGAGFAAAVGDVVVGFRVRIREAAVADVAGGIEAVAFEAFDEHGRHDLGREIGERERRRHSRDGGEEGALHFVHGHVEAAPYFVHQKDHAFLCGK